MPSLFGLDINTVDLYARNFFEPLEASRLARQEQVQQVFMQLLEQLNSQGRNAKHARTSNNYAPVTFAKETEAIKHGLRKADFEAAMRGLSHRRAGEGEDLRRYRRARFRG